MRPWVEVVVVQHRHGGWVGRVMLGESLLAEFHERTQRSALQSARRFRLTRPGCPVHVPSKDGTRTHRSSPSVV